MGDWLIFFILAAVCYWPQYLSEFNNPLGKLLWLALIALLADRHHVLALVAAVAFIQILNTARTFHPVVWQPDQLNLTTLLRAANSNNTPVIRNMKMTAPIYDEPYSKF
jgi:hypothetical protein